MWGSGILKGLGVTLGHFLRAYLADARGFPRRYRADAQAVRQTPRERGLFTIQYPEEKRAMPERFRFLPMLLYDADTGEMRCTACGICARVCPPQCIWIVRAVGEDGKALRTPAEFSIDTSLCMSCGLCAEFCPFDSIKMDHRYELSSYEREESWIYGLERLLVSTEYYAQTHPTAWAEEEERRQKKAAQDG
jgi:NADH-quinone oxidoreductase subunit I